MNAKISCQKSKEREEIFSQKYLPKSFTKENANFTV